VKYLVLAILLFACGAGLTQLRVEDEQTYVPVVRTRTAEGLFLTLLHVRVTNQKACQQTVARFAALLRPCASCTIESSECATELAGIDKAISEGRPVPLYMVAAEGVRISLVGPPSIIKSECESIAGHMVLNGLKSAACVYPQRDPV
jgi:hypothetical protein